MVAAFSAVDSSKDKRPCWAMVVLASSTVLSDVSLFFHRFSPKLFLQSLRPAPNHKHPGIRAVREVVWRTLVWAFSQVSSEVISGLRHDIGTGKPEDFRGHVFQTLKRELKGGIGIALVTSLLGDSTPTSHDSSETSHIDVSRALAVIGDMVSGVNRCDPGKGIPRRLIKPLMPPLLIPCSNPVILQDSE